MQTLKFLKVISEKTQKDTFFLFLIGIKIILVARYWMLEAGALGRPRGMVRGGRREESSGWGTRVYLWWIHVDIWQNQYNTVKLKNKIK